MSHRILYLTDRQEAVEQAAAALEQDYLPAELVRVQGRQAFANALAGAWSCDLVLLGEPLAGFSAGEALAQVQARWPDLPVLVLPDRPDEASWAGWLYQGAAECIPRNALFRLAPAVRRILREARDRAALHRAQGDHVRLAALLRAVLESTREGVLVADLAGRIATYNRKFMSLCGIPEYVLAPMELDPVLRFLQEQFVDPAAFLNEVRLLGDGPGRRPLGLVRLGRQGLAQAYGQTVNLGDDTVGRLFSLAELPGTTPAEPQAAADLLAAAREGRVVPWHLTEEELVISDKGRPILGQPPDDLPMDLPALMERIHPDDRERFRQALEQPQAAPFALRLRRSDGAWIATRWSLKRSAGGYRGIFSQVPDPPGGRS